MIAGDVKVIDEVCAKDAAYFEQHPDNTVYYRKAVSGEFPPEIAKECPPFHFVLVEVQYLGPGVRTRTPYYMPAWTKQSMTEQ